MPSREDISNCNSSFIWEMFGQDAQHHVGRHKNCQAQWWGLIGLVLQPQNHGTLRPMSQPLILCIPKYSRVKYDTEVWSKCGPSSEQYLRSKSTTERLKKKRIKVLK
ncbi:hypothetical protein AMECASPLE_031762 [Ameca splendens]|uniref:Uncharacterized protein n=1 Tax=Ameca splendens TaxID=208324 RepID=A0ABV0Z6C1_9TELE